MVRCRSFYSMGASYLTNIQVDSVLTQWQLYKFIIGEGGIDRRGDCPTREEELLGEK